MTDTTPQTPQKKTLRQHISAAKQFVNDHPVGSAYMAGGIVGSVATGLFATKLEIKGINQLARELYRGIQEANLELEITTQYLSGKGLLGEFDDFRDAQIFVNPN